MKQPQQRHCFPLCLQSSDMQSKPPKLTIKQATFCEEYVTRGHAIHAYFAAFGRTSRKGLKRSYDAANHQCHRMMALPHVKAEIEAIRAGMRSRCEVTLDDLNRADAQAAFLDVAMFVTRVNGECRFLLPDELPPEVRGCVRKFKVRRRTVKPKDGSDSIVEIEDIEYDLLDALRARENLAKRLGFDKPQTPLAQLLAALSPELRAKVWAEIAPLLTERS